MRQGLGGIMFGEPRIHRSAGTLHWWENLLRLNATR